MEQASSSNYELAAMVGKRMSAFLERALGRAGGDGADAAVARGTILALGGFHDQAAQSLEQALAIDGKSNEAAARLVFVKLRVGELTDALETAVRLASTAPDYAMEEITTGGQISSFSILGLALLANGRQREAFDAFRSGEEANPGDSIAWAYLAQLAAKDGSIRDASGDSKGRANPRFAGLASLLGAEGRGRNVLSAASIGALSRRDLVAVHGRPLVTSEGAQFATIDEGSDWCEPV